jgi:diaminopropionate ammonia-lyase
LAAQEPYARAALGLGAESRVLLFGTEGATDPEVYAKLVQG